MAIITYDRTIPVNQEEAERWAEIADRPAVPLPDDGGEWEESLRRGREWVKNFSKQSNFV